MITVRTLVPDKSGQVQYYGRSSDWWAYEITHWRGVIGRYAAPKPRNSEIEEWFTKVTGIQTRQRLAIEGDGGALLLIGDPEAIPVLEELLRHPDARVRLHAAKALHMASDSRTETARYLLTKASMDEDESVRRRIQGYLEREKGSG
jgi:hypothetical protein